MFRVKRELRLFPVVGLAVLLAGCGGGSSSGGGVGDFTLTISPTTLKVSQGTTGTITVTISDQNGFSGSVTPSASGLPTGVTAAFSPTPATTSTTLTLTATPTATLGKATVTITGVSGSVASTTTFPLAVSQATGVPETTTTLSSSLNPSTYGEAVTFTAAVISEGTPLPASTNGETVTFKQGTTPIGTGTMSSGSATFTTSTLSAGGTDNILAVYPGDATYAPSTSSPVSQVVTQASTTTMLTSLENPANVGQAVTFQATVSSGVGIQVTGLVGFYDGTSKLGNATLANGVADFTITNSNESGASETITAEYEGSPSSFASSQSSPVIENWDVGTAIDVCDPSLWGAPCVNNNSNFVTTWDGVERDYQVYVPVALPSNPAIVVMLHGTQINSTLGNPIPVIQLDWGWQAVANYYGFILVTPASTYDTSSNQWNWNASCMDDVSLLYGPWTNGSANCGGDPQGAAGGAFPYAENCGSKDGECPDDIGFLGALIESLLGNNATTNPIYGNFTASPSMVYVTGFSSGAQMTERVGVELSGTVAAIIPASGPLVNLQGTFTGNSYPSPFPLPQSPVAPISVQEWSGTEDVELPPCDGYYNTKDTTADGTTNYSGVIFTLSTVDVTFNYWTANNFSEQNPAVFQTTATLCTTPQGDPSVNDNAAADAPTPPYPEPPNTPVMPNTLTGNIAVSAAPSTPITAASESGTTVTITSTLNPGVDEVAFITDVTPSAYNGTWIVTQSSATSFQYINTASGLADATAFGTATGGQTTEVQFIWEPGIAHDYQTQYDWARWLFFAAHPCPMCGPPSAQAKSNSNSKDKRYEDKR